MDRLIRLGAWADKEFITGYRADGLIFSTATGSTAYNLSAGGPIVHPMLQSITVTPICPFMLESRPVLLPAGVVVTTRMLDHGPTSVQVIVDGRQTWEMGEKDVLEVMAAEQPLLLICSPKKGYFEILRNKLNWGGGGRKSPEQGGEAAKIPRAAFAGRETGLPRLDGEQGSGLLVEPYFFILYCSRLLVMPRSSAAWAWTLPAFSNAASIIFFSMVSKTSGSLVP